MNAINSITAHIPRRELRGMICVPQEARINKKANPRRRPTTTIEFGTSFPGTEDRARRRDARDSLKAD
jgi:hypothetical protein